MGAKLDVLLVIFTVFQTVDYCSLLSQLWPRLSVVHRLTKALFFSSPDNCPDTEALLRLWTHEALRVVGDALPAQLQHKLTEVSGISENVTSQ